MNKQILITHFFLQRTFVWSYTIGQKYKKHPGRTDSEGNEEMGKGK